MGPRGFWVTKRWVRSWELGGVAVRQTHTLPVAAMQFLINPFSIQGLVKLKGRERDSKSHVEAV